MITDKYIKRGDKLIKKVQLLYVDSEEKLCDGCDEDKICASVRDVSGNVSTICKSCLEEMIDQF